MRTITFALFVGCSAVCQMPVEAGGDSIPVTVRAVERISERRFRLVLRHLHLEDSFFATHCKAIIVTGDHSGPAKAAPESSSAATNLEALKALEKARDSKALIRFGGMINAFERPDPSNSCDFLVGGLIVVTEYGGTKAVYAYR